MAAYSLLMGSLGGLALSGAVFAVWIGAGSVMGWGNPNWMLIIGTYTGNAPSCLQRVQWA